MGQELSLAPSANESEMVITKSPVKDSYVTDLKRVY